MTDLDAIEKRAREARGRAGKATVGPWESDEDGFDGTYDVSVKGAPDIVCESAEKRNADFIASARTDVPLLADDVLALVAEVRLAREWLASYDGPDNGPTVTEHEAAEAYRALVAKRGAP